jgi:hypothetical protein
MLHRKVLAVFSITCQNKKVCSVDKMRDIVALKLVVHTMVSQEVPGMEVLHCNGQTYGNAYLITFKVGLLRAYTLAPSILPLLEAPAEGFFWNLPEFSHRIRFDVIHGCETCPLEAHYQSREQPKVIRSEIRRLWWLGVDRNCCTTSNVWLGALS